LLVVIDMNCSKSPPLLQLLLQETAVGIATDVVFTQ
jgi:hypothetical protein